MTPGSGEKKLSLLIVGFDTGTFPLVNWLTLTVRQEILACFTLGNSVKHSKKTEEKQLISNSYNSSDKHHLPTI